MNRYTLAQIGAGLPPEVQAIRAAPRNVMQLAPGGAARAFAGRSFPDLNIAAAANLPARQGFDALAPDMMNRLLGAVLAFGPVAALTNASRAEWLPVIFALADAEQRGASDARRLGLGWSMLGQAFSQTDFDRDWSSSQPGRTGVGTLLRLARQAGFDFQPWFQASQAAPTPPASTPFGGGPFLVPVRFQPADLQAVPWVVDGLLVRGDLTVMAGQGGGAKTAAAISLCAALASGRVSWGPFRIMPRADGAPRPVAFLSGEEDPNRIGLLVEAACRALNLTAGERANAAANLLVHDARASGWRLGEPRPGTREDIAPEAEDRNLTALRAGLAAHPVDLVVLDTMAGLFATPNENDNNALTRLMGRLARALRDAGCAGLLIHHAPKTTREGAAAQRGEATLVRGGSAIVNTARVVLTLTGLPLQEAAAAAVSGTNPDAVRRLEAVRINDRAPPAPAYLEVMGELVTVHDGSQHSIRAVRFTAAPVPASSGGLPTATMNAAMRAIDAGVIVAGVRLPLSPGGGKGNARDGTHHIGQALRAADPSLSEPHARAAARDVLDHLRDGIGCVLVQDVPVAKQTGGKPNGKGMVRGLACRWDLAPWMHPAPVPGALPAPGLGAAPDGLALPAAAPDGAQGAVTPPNHPIAT